MIRFYQWDDWGVYAAAVPDDGEILIMEFSKWGLKLTLSIDREYWTAQFDETDEITIEEWHQLYAHFMGCVTE